MSPRTLGSVLAAAGLLLVAAPPAETRHAELRIDPEQVPPAGLYLSLSFQNADLLADPAERLFFGVPVNLHDADAALLQGVPGIGPVLAARIAERRERLGFGSWDEVAAVPGVGPVLLGRLQARFVLDAGP